MVCVGGSNRYWSSVYCKALQMKHVFIHSTLVFSVLCVHSSSTTVYLSGPGQNSIYSNAELADEFVCLCTWNRVSLGNHTFWGGLGLGTSFSRTGNSNHALQISEWCYLVRFC